MMTTWFLVVGLVLVTMAFTGAWVARSPVSPALLYLLLGAMLASFTGVIGIDTARDAWWIEVLAEIAVLISLFAVGLKLGVPLRSGGWMPAVRLATIGMLAAIVAATLIARVLLDLPWAAALLLAAIVAPTDPVLASDVQVRDAGERDALRVTLSAEGGLNDGIAFPFVLLGLGLLGAHELGAYGTRWVWKDLVWGVAGALAIGWLLAEALAALLRRVRQWTEPMRFEEFLVLGAIAVVYGTALLAQTYGFLAVFAAGLALRQRERRDEYAARRTATANLTEGHAGRLQHFTEQLERLAEVAVVLVVGALVAQARPGWASVVFAILVLVVARPLSALIALWPVRLTDSHFRYIAWFGIRGVGSVYYLTYALNHGVSDPLAAILAEATLVLIAASITAHGVSATPLMRLRDRRRTRPPRARPQSR